jgi:hypothetical protein
MKTNLCMAFAALALAAALPLAARADDVTHEATLEATGVDQDAHGRARFEVKTHNRLRLEIEAEDVFSTDTVAVFINGDFLMTLDVVDGRAEVELETEHGDAVPMINAGDVIDIVDANDGSPLLEGVFN